MVSPRQYGNVNEQLEFVHEQLAGIAELQDGFDALGFSQGTRAALLRCFRELDRTLSLQEANSFAPMSNGTTLLR